MSEAASISVFDSDSITDTFAVSASPSVSPRPRGESPWVLLDRALAGDGKVAPALANHVFPVFEDWC